MRILRNIAFVMLFGGFVWADPYFATPWVWQEQFADDGWRTLYGEISQALTDFKRRPFERGVHVFIANRTTAAVEQVALSINGRSRSVPTVIFPRSVYIYETDFEIKNEDQSSPLLALVCLENKRSFETSALVPHFADDPHSFLTLDIREHGATLSELGDIGSFSEIEPNIPFVVNVLPISPSYDNVKTQFPTEIIELERTANSLDEDSRKVIDTLSPRAAVIKAEVKLSNDSVANEHRAFVLYCLLRAARANDRDALYHLGCCLFSGYACSENKFAAYGFFLEATKASGYHHGTELMLGYCAEKGIAGKVDPALARKHYLLAMLGRRDTIAALRYAYLCFCTSPRDRLLSLNALAFVWRRQWPAQPILRGLMKHYPHGVPLDGD